MTKTTAPKAPRLTKAQKLALAQLEAPTAIETEVVETEATMLIVQGSLDQALTTEVIEQIAEAMPEDTWVDPIKWVDETPTIDQAMASLVVVKPHKVVKTVKTGVGQQILQHIADGVLSNKEIVAKVLEANPLRKTTYACVAWYQSQVRAGKIDLPSPMIEVMDQEW